MLKPRVIPCLLLKNKGLVKTLQFNNPRYVGDPLNAVKIFNEKEVEELIFLDITASKEKNKPNFELIANIANECFMPFCYGGGVRDLNDMKKIFNFGIEKIAINSYVIENPYFIKKAAATFGSQSIVVSIDVKKNCYGKYLVYDSSKNATTNLNLLEHAVQVEKLGGGEILLCSVDRDGTLKGYDLELIKNVTKIVTIPVIACGGAGKLDDFTEAIKKGAASAVAAGSLFMFHGKHQAVLINYPTQNELKKLMM